MLFFFFFVECLKLSAYDRLRWSAVSSIQTSPNKWSIVASQEKLCVFLDNRQVSYGFQLPYTYGYTPLVYKEIMFDIPKLKLCSIDPEYCMLFFVFVMWLRINADRTVSSKAWYLGVQQEKNV